MCKIYIVEDEILVAKSIENIITHNGYDCAGIATSYEQAKQDLMELNPDLILCDINLNGTKTGIDLMDDIQSFCTVPFIFISAYSDIDTLKKADSTSPLNYITKPFNDNQLLACLRRFVLSSDVNLEEVLPTDREISIIELASKGYGNREMAEILNLSVNTIETHRKKMIKRHNVHSMSELVCMATSKGWVKYIGRN